ncbi:MAG: glycosyltransferase [Desulfatiglandaceae bacterium]
MENFLRDLLHALQKEGVSVSALVHHHLLGEPFCREREDGISIFRAPLRGQVLYAPISPSFPGLLRQSIKSFRPHLVHFHLPNLSAFWSIFIPEVRAIPWVIQWQSDVVASKIDRRMGVAYGLYRPFEQYILRRSRAIVATSRPYLLTSRALAPFMSKCHVVPLGLDPMRLKMPSQDLIKWAEMKWAKGGTRVLAIGRLTYYKGHEVLIQAAVRIPDVRVFIVGEGERRPRLERLVKELGLQERVTLPGLLEESRLHALLATCDCLCLPSIERTEAFGLVLLEAMKYARPVVVSDVPGSGIGWVVRHGKTGLLVRPGDPGELGKALEVMGGMSGLREGMGRAAKERFDEVFQIDQVAQEIAVMYQDILRT